LLKCGYNITGLWKAGHCQIVIFRQKGLGAEKQIHRSNTGCILIVSDILWDFLEMPWNKYKKAKKAKKAKKQASKRGRKSRNSRSGRDRYGSK